MDLELKGKRALITGASKGIGRACAEVLAQEGCHVRLVSRTADALEKAADEIHARHGVDAQWKAADLSQRGAAEAVAGWAGELDILVNNAGAIPGGDLIRVDEETWRRAWDLKVFGYINLSRQVYAQMKARRSGVIVNVVGSAGEKMNAAYITGSTGNAALGAFTRALGGASHADVNPGPIATDRLVGLYKQMAQTQLGDAARYEELFKGMSFDRPGAPEEVAWTVAFFASPRSSYTSGCMLTIDGGQVNR
jgi:NAD(P)-dependent dehydrogenase (short-subunit alcohol dehydrogenase family)